MYCGLRNWVCVCVLLLLTTFMVCIFMIFLPPLSPSFTECPGTCSQHPSSGLRSSLVTLSSLTSSALTTFYSIYTTFSPVTAGTGTALPLKTLTVMLSFLSHFLLLSYLLLPFQTSVIHPLLHPSYPLVFSPFNLLYFLPCLVRVPWEFLLLTLLIPLTPNIQLQPFPSLLEENGVTLAYSTYHLQYPVFSCALSFDLFLNSHRRPFSFLPDTQFWVTPVGDRFGGHAYYALGTSFSANTPAPTPTLPHVFGKGWTFDTEPQWVDQLTIGQSDFLSTVCSYII